jgi:uncharacterized membrane protein (DUF485 family)
VVEASTQREAGLDVDWDEIERSPEFQELVRRRKAFVVPGTIFFLAWYMGFILLVAYAEDFMSRRVYEGLTVGYCLALTQFVMVVVLGLLYLRKSDNEFDPLAEKAIERYSGQRERFSRSDVGSRAAGSTSEVER